MDFSDAVSSLKESGVPDLKLPTDLLDLKNHIKQI